MDKVISCTRCNNIISDEVIPTLDADGLFCPPCWEQVVMKRKEKYKKDDNYEVE